MRGLTATTVALTTLVAFIVAGPAVAASELPVSYVYPTNGETYATSDRPIHLEVHTTPGLGDLFVEVSTSNLPGQDGTLADDFQVDFTILTESDAFPGQYTGAGEYWPGEQGTYYWQAYGYPDTGLALTPVFNVTLDEPLTLGMHEAKGYMRRLLRDEFGATYRHGYAKRLRGCSRRSAIRVRCKRASWVIGDLFFIGRVTIRVYEEDDGEQYWTGSYAIRRYDEYCLYRKQQGDPSFRGRSCKKTYRG